MTEELLESLSEDALVLEPRETYDKCIIGTSQNGLAIYDAEKIIEAGIELFDDYESSLEWHDFNTFNAYLGEFTPIYLFK
jgi:hypothetical protein